ncbi:MAG: phosphatase PAP2 family protein [bacterium]|nr:phosphatase PAP2 family protein [bacterium]
MEFLRLLVNLRTPFLDALFGAITYLGDETLFMIVAMVFFWCVEKRKGYFLLFTGFCGTLINQFLKMLFCVPRPWLIDPSFPIVENARAAATGYSFPSGHTQNITGTFGGIARFTGRRWLRACAIAVVLLVAFSRMYLGVHTPLDVGVSLVIGTALVLLLWPLFRRADERPGILTGLFAALLLGTLAFVLYAELAPLPANAIPAFSEHGVKNAYTLLGVSAGLLLAHALDTRFIRFDPRAPFAGQLLKCVLGFALVMAVRAGLKAPLYALLGGHYAADAIRYFLMVLVGGVLWPLTFRFWSRLGRRSAERTSHPAA